MLEAVKEYVDAAFAYHLSGVSRINSGSSLAPSVSLTEAGKEIQERYLKAEAELNRRIAIQNRTV